MNPKTRYFLIGSALVVVVGLGTGLVASYSSQLGFGLPRQTEFDYLPPDASAIAYADVHDIMNSEMNKRFLKLIITGTDSNMLFEMIWINVARYIAMVVASLLSF